MNIEQTPDPKEQEEVPLSNWVQGNASILPEFNRENFSIIGDTEKGTEKVYVNESTGDVLYSLHQSGENFRFDRPAYQFVFSQIGSLFFSINPVSFLQKDSKNELSAIDMNEPENHRLDNHYFSVVSPQMEKNSNALEKKNLLEQSFVYALTFHDSDFYMEDDEYLAEKSIGKNINPETGRKFDFDYTFHANDLNELKNQNGFKKIEHQISAFDEESQVSFYKDSYEKMKYIYDNVHKPDFLDFIKKVCKKVEVDVAQDFAQKIYSLLLKSTSEGLQYIQSQISK